MNRRHARWLSGALAATLLAAPLFAHGDPLRLRADALASTSSPAGLLALGGDGVVEKGLSAEAMIWLAADSSRDTGVVGDALVIALRAQTRDGRVQGRLGRFVTTVGALPPQHIDGVAGRARLPKRFDLEAFAGVPVVRKFAAAKFDWAVGGRVSRRLGDWGGAGVGWLERRSAGRLDARYLGLDGSVAAGKLDVAGRAVVDGSNGSLADFQLVATKRFRKWRGELAVQRRVASLLLPRTSLFSVLGDIASDRLGAVARLRAAPRLDLVFDAGIKRIDTMTELEGTARANLRLDDKGRGLLQFELRRQAAVAGGFTGGRIAARVPTGNTIAKGQLLASAELELAIADVDRERGTVWPWGVAALAWQRCGWQAAVAVEGGSSPRDQWRVDVLGQLSKQWEAP